MTKTTIKNMIDNVEWVQYQIRVLNVDNFYCTTTDGKSIPYVNTLTNLSCYATIPSDSMFQAYKLKSQIKTPYGYVPFRVEMQDIPFTKMRFRLIVNVSLPKVLRGHNATEIYEHEWEEIVDAIYLMLAQFGIEISKRELKDTPHIRRIDFCKNSIIQTPVDTFVALLQMFKKPRSKIYYSYNPSISFGTKKKRLTIYDKIAEVIVKADKNPESITYKLAKHLISLQEVWNIHVIRIEQRLYGRQTIVRELTPIMDSEDITFKSLFSEKVASYILNKHWSSLVNEEKFKTLLLGEQNLHTIITEIAKLLRMQHKHKVNPIYPLYMKLMAEVGEEAAHRDLKYSRKVRSLIDFKKELYELMKQLPMYDTRLVDYQTITKAITQWETFSLPTIPS